jgi:hypothetical protein
MGSDIFCDDIRLLWFVFNWAIRQKKKRDYRMDNLVVLFLLITKPIFFN